MRFVEDGTRCTVNMYGQQCINAPSYKQATPTKWIYWCEEHASHTDKSGMEKLEERTP